MRTTNSWPVLFCWGLAAIFFAVSVNYRASRFYADWGHEHRFKTDNATAATANAVEYLARNGDDGGTANACLVCSAIFLLMGCVERLRVAVLQPPDLFEPPPRPPLPEGPEQRARDWETTAAFLTATNPTADRAPTMQEVGRGFAEMWRQTVDAFWKAVAAIRKLGR